MYNASEAMSELMAKYCSSILSVLNSHKDSEEDNEEAGVGEQKKLIKLSSKILQMHRNPL
jgi:hypothetical protein